MNRLSFHWLLLCALFTSATLHADEHKIRVVTDRENRPNAVEEIGWTKEQLQSMAKTLDDAAIAQPIQVYVLNEKGEIQKPELAGRREIVNGAIRFTPQFPFRPGMSYRVYSIDAKSTLDIKVPAATLSE